MIRIFEGPEHVKWEGDFVKWDCQVGVFFVKCTPAELYIQMNRKRKADRAQKTTNRFLISPQTLNFLTNRSLNGWPIKFV